MTERSERGSATVLVLAAAALVAAFGVAAALVAGVLLAGTRARTAADLAALAAADVLGRAGDPCAAAATVARANDARLASCVPSGTAVTVVAEVAAPAAFGRPVRATARAEPGSPLNPGPAAADTTGRTPGSRRFARMETYPRNFLAAGALGILTSRTTGHSRTVRPWTPRSRHRPSPSSRVPRAAW